MEASTQEEFRQSNQVFLLEFMTRTAHLEDELAESMKATMSQFLCSVRKDITVIASENDGMISEPDIYQGQIDALRRCIIDLEQCLQRCLTRSVTVQ